VCGAAYILPFSGDLRVNTKYEYLPGSLEIVALVRLNLLGVSFFLLSDIDGWVDRY
jgi:hypothetical protein